MAQPLDPNLVRYLENQRLGNGRKTAGRKLVIFSVPKIGKTVLAARLGMHNMFIADDGDGYSALMNESVQPLIGHWDVLPFMDWASVKQMLQAGEAGQIRCECGEPIDNWVLDTASGMIMLELQKIIATAGTPLDGKVAPEAPGRPDYMVSRDRLIPVMSQISSMRNASVTLLMHMREQGKVQPQVVPDAHNAAVEVINKYVSVQAYLSMNDKGQRILQVRANGNRVVVGSRYDFPDDFVSDDEFVKHIEQWKASAEL